MPTHRFYCSVFGCLNSSKDKPGLSFFRLPSDEDRRRTWLRLISREDLAYKPSKAYTICEEHFHADYINTASVRKTLKKDALPTLKLQEMKLITPIKTEECLILPSPKQTAEKCVSTREIVLIPDSTQTPKYFMCPACRREADKGIIDDPPRKIKIKFKSDKQQKELFLQMCDKFLTKEMADMVKAEVPLTD